MMHTLLGVLICVAFVALLIAAPFAEAGKICFPAVRWPRRHSNDN